MTRLFPWLALVLLAGAVWRLWGPAASPDAARVPGEAQTPPSMKPVPDTATAPTGLDRALRLRLVQHASLTACHVELVGDRARETGLQDGDVILRVGDDAITPRLALGLVRRIEEAWPDGVRMTVLRDGAQTVVFVVAPHAR